MRTAHRVGIAFLALSIAGAAAACGDDDKAADPTTTTKAEPKTVTVTVTAVNYAYEGLPKTLAVGDKLSLTNKSTDELHEMVVFRIPDAEKRSVADLVQLPEAELDTLFAGEPAAVILAPPGGGDPIPAVGDGTIDKAGRYVVVCTIPTGADPEAFLNAPPSDGPPDVPGGPPHFTKGMYGEITVE